MLKVTVELWPGGRESGRRVIATADIGRIRDGAFADYRVRLEEQFLNNVGDEAVVADYPRWSASVWDLVARCLAAALNDGREALPPRPMLPVAREHERDGRRYVRLREIPEPAQTFFRRRIADSSRCPHVEEDAEPKGWAYAEDWEDFLRGRL